MASEGPQDPSFSRFTECSVCLGRIKNHRCLPCMHTFCHDCLVPLVQSYSLTCPLCRKECSLIQCGLVSGLPQNPVLMEILEKVCQKCQERNKEIQCARCGKCECPTCHEICKLHAEVQEKIQERSEKLEEIRKKKEQQEIIDETVLEFEKEADKQIAPLDDLHAKLTTEIKHMESFIDKTDKERMQLTVSSVKQLGEDRRKSFKSESMDNPVPSDTAQYGPNVDTIKQEITKSAGRLSMETVDMGTSIKSPGIVEHAIQSAISRQITTTDYSSKNINYECLDLGFSSPTGVAVSPVTENIAVIDAENDRIKVFDSQGKYLTKFGSYGCGFSGQFFFHGTGGLDFTSDGHIAVCDTGINRMQILKEQGEVVRVFGARRNGPGDFCEPRGLVVNGDELYVADCWNHRIQVLTYNGTYIREFGRQEMAQDWYPEDVAVCKSGDVVVAVHDEDGANGKLMIYTSDGRYTRSLCTGESGSVKLEFPRGVTLDSQENIIVTDFHTHKVHVVTKEGQNIHSFGSYGDKPGQFDGPSGVACTKNDTIIIADWGNSRLQYVKLE